MDGEEGRRRRLGSEQLLGACPACCSAAPTSPPPPANRRPPAPPIGASASSPASSTPAAGKPTPSAAALRAVTAQRLCKAHLCLPWYASDEWVCRALEEAHRLRVRTTHRGALAFCWVASRQFPGDQAASACCWEQAQANRLLVRSQERLRYLGSRRCQLRSHSRVLRACLLVLAEE